MELSLTKLPWYAQIAAFVVLAAGGTGAFYWYYEAPAWAEIASREGQLQALRRDISKGTETAQKLPEFREEVEDLEARLISLRSVLPEEKDAAELLRSMQNVATQSNLTIKSFKPANSITQQLHAEWPINLELEGTYHDLALFFDRIGKFTRIVNITNLSIKGRDGARDRSDGSTSIAASCVATTFVLLDKPNPTAKPARGAAAQKKKEA